MKDYLILLLVVLSCYHVSVVDGLKGGLHRNNRRAKNLAAEKIPCTDNCNSPMDTNVDEATEPLKGPSVGSVENTADSNNINNLIQEKLMESFNSFLQTNSQAQSKVEPREGGSSAMEELLPWDRIRLTAQSCQEGPTYSRYEPANMKLITDQEQCNVCSRIVVNSNRWNWKKHYSSLCVGLPRHLLALCKHWACKMSVHCPEFIGNKCIVDGYERMPCPKKYLCWNCLGIPKKNIANCFDNLDTKFHRTNGI
jgi:hypothetical protein